jgi:hypothetical protein
MSRYMSDRFTLTDMFAHLQQTHIPMRSALCIIPQSTWQSSLNLVGFVFLQVIFMHSYISISIFVTMVEETKTLAPQTYLFLISRLGQVRVSSAKTQHPPVGRGTSLQGQLSESATVQH